MVNEPSVFEPSKFYCISMLILLLILFDYYKSKKDFGHFFQDKHEPAHCRIAEVFAVPPKTKKRDPTMSTTSAGVS